MMVAVIGRDFCNIFGDDINGARVVMGGMEDPSRVDRQWYCPTRAVDRYYMQCEHGHRGQTMKLCRKHFNEFNGKVTFCPACNTDPNNGHKCAVRLETIS